MGKGTKPGKSLIGSGEQGDKATITPPLLRTIQDLVNSASEHGSVSLRAVSKKLGQNESTTSKYLKLFEEAYGKLFKRDRGHSLNIRDREAFEAIRVRVNAIIRSIEQLGSHNQPPRVRLGTLASVDAFYLPLVVAEATSQSDLQGAEIDVITAPPDRLLPLLAEENLDLLILCDEVRIVGKVGLHCERLFGHSFKGFLINRALAPAHLLDRVNQPGQFRFADLAGQNCYLISPSVRADIHDLFARMLPRGEKGVQQVLTLESYSQITCLVRTVGGVGLGHEHLGAEGHPDLAFIDVRQSPDFGDAERRQAVSDLLIDRVNFYLISRKVKEGEEPYTNLTKAARGLVETIRTTAKRFDHERAGRQKAPRKRTDEPSAPPRPRKKASSR